jgi:acyl-CoA synthetase (AMP-forming)/AMP-acid ligase II
MYRHRQFSGDPHPGNFLLQPDGSVAFLDFGLFKVMPAELIGDIREHVAKRIGKLARPKRVIWADDLPKTRSGKIMRRLLRDIAEGRELGDVTTLRDPDVMSQLEGKIKEREAEGEE